VERAELVELHYIAPIDNVPSIVQTGIVSHRRAANLRHQSVSMPEVQDKRAKVMVPGGRPLHDYANLYICARNPMLFKRKGQHANLCVLRIDPAVLDLPGVVISDSNAASEYVRFAAAPSGLTIVDRELTFAEYWTDGDSIQKWRKAARKCAEVLVPERVEVRYVMGAYVSCQDSLALFDALASGVTATVNAHLFFR
jgi:hypothetical protein